MGRYQNLGGCNYNYAYNSTLSFMTFLNWQNFILTYQLNRLHWLVEIFSVNGIIKENSYTKVTMAFRKGSDSTPSKRNSLGKWHVEWVSVCFSCHLNVRAKTVLIFVSLSLSNLIILSYVFWCWLLPSHLYHKRNQSVDSYSFCSFKKHIVTGMEL